MSEKFTFELGITNGEATLRLIGQMDEDMDLVQATQVSEEIVKFDFAGVSSINSCGIRDWINFLGDFKSSNSAIKSIVYMNCPQHIIEQMNMVKGFLPEQARIESFYAPFFCESCDNEEKILLRPSDIVDLKAPTDLACSNCSKVGLEFDALAAQYFHFLK